jgi:hypothetical protein
LLIFIGLSSVYIASVTRTFVEGRGFRFQILAFSSAGTDYKKELGIFAGSASRQAGTASSRSRQFRV